MVNIMLVCSAGMSTSLLVTKMNKEAKEKNIGVNIWAIPEANVAKEIEKADVILLGPQVRYLLSKIKEQSGGKPVIAIDMRSYGLIDGKKVLEDALNLIK